MMEDEEEESRQWTKNMRTIKEFEKIEAMEKEDLEKSAKKKN